jgi:hypothetical protein
VPDTYRGNEHLADCLIALELSNRLRASVLAVMQNLYIVYGKPGWSSQFLISCVNACGRFSPLRYQLRGEPGKDSRGCLAWAKDKEGERLEGPEVTIGMAKEEGWYERKGSKWKTMSELMLRYRAATLFTRLYAPELTMGIQTVEELADLGQVSVAPAKAPEEDKPQFAPVSVAAAATAAEATKVLTDQVKAFLADGGFTHEQLVAWCKREEFLPGIEKFSAETLPPEFCSKILTARAGLLAALKGAYQVS